MKWVIIKGVRYPNSVISAFAAYNMDNPFLKVRIRNKYHIDLELAKKISNGEYDGEIVTVGHNHKVELVYYNKDRGMFNTLGVIYSDSGIISDWFSDNGLGARGCRLCINIPEYTAFKDGDILSNEEGDYLFILNTNGEYLTSYHASWQEGGYLYFDNGAANRNNIER